MEQVIDNSENKVLTDIRSLIEQTRQQVAISVNAGMTMMYWHIGERINREVLGGGRAAYGKQIVDTISQQLTKEYGGSQFSVKNLNRMRLFAERFPDLSIWTPLVSKLSWSHFLQVISIEDGLKRQFYLTMAADQRWSKRTLKAKIDGMLYERTAIAKQPDEVILHDLERLRDDRPAVFQPPLALHGGHRPEADRLQGCIQGSDGTLSALARKI